ncbi:MAG TPA: four helix bundle protein [Nitrospirae bacterium]|nr:four helix bundle protein [Nitrospirota bacterium]
MKTHKDLDIWQKGMQLVENIYKLTATFPKDELYGLISQMRRAAISFPSNIAEGAARSSKKEFIQYSYIALGTLSELETQIIISSRLGYHNDESILGEIETLRKMTLNFIKYLKNK